MATPNVTPFIPPLGTPAPSPNAQAQPPLVPAPPANPQYPAWASQPQSAGSYPIYPSTPYTTGTPFIPSYTPAGPPAGYFPGTGPPGTARPLPPEMGPMPGGYPGFGPPSMSPWANAHNSPWPVPGAHAPPGTPWSQGHSHLSPYAAVGAHPAPQQRPGMWGGPQMAGGFTPAAADPWGAPPPPWAQAQMQQQHMMMGGGGMHGMMGGGGGMHGMMGGMPGMMGGGMGMGMGGGMGLGFGGAGMPDQQQPLSRAIGQVGDRVGPFEEGTSYGPVLEPFLIRAVRAHVRLNPLISPAPDAGAQPFLKWNMLFQSNQCQRSDDPVHLSWSKGRNQPATFPRVTFLRLVSEAFPWTISVTARNRDVGVTCGDVIDTISRTMYQLTSQSEYEALASARRRAVGEAYRHNRSRAHGVPGGSLNPGMLRLDWLVHDTRFGGVRENERLVRRVCGDLLPCTFELACVRQYPMTAEEVRNLEALQRSNARTTRRSSQRPSVESVRDEDEPDSDDDDDDDDDEEEEERGRSRGRR
ncbi:hypothetical protein GGX14DRAFT_430412 [Mycena pura]|uniref:DUF6699 domain-containing protein n=1 Tax=Mycena pura TaxID=153505 RepID=A0AAD6YK90_9AGAR|nr:hypothetical protein GGX14DRAFT_430412 [Mycena pura]